MFLCLGNLSKVNKMEQNKEGLTWFEWARAANVSTKEIAGDKFRAWINGEDPTEWRIESLEKENRRLNSVIDRLEKELDRMDSKDD